MTPNEVCNVILHHRDKYLIPKIDSLTPEYVHSLFKVNEGNSKTIYSLTPEYDLVIYKPTVYSHRQKERVL